MKKFGEFTPELGLLRLVPLEFSAVYFDVCFCTM